MSRATDIGDAVVAAINTQSFSKSFVSKRMYRPVNELKALSTLTVTILVPSVQHETTTRMLSGDIVTVDVLIQKQADHSDLETTDQLLDLAEEIADFLRGREMGHGIWLGTEIVTIYDMEDISEWRLFSALIRLSYKQHYRPN